MKDNADDRPRRPRSPLNRSIWSLAGGMVRGIGTPTQLISLPGASDQVTQRHARSVIDFCLRVGEAMLATGASAADVVATVLRIGAQYGITAMHVDITFTSVSASAHRGLDEDPITVMRVVRVRTLDYSRLQDVYLLIDEITSADAPMDVGLARDKLGSILTQPHPYRRWVATLGKAVLAGGVAFMYDVSFVIVLIAAASAVVADLVTRRLGKWGISAFFAQLAAAAVMTLIAVFMFWLRSVGVHIPGANLPTVIVISGIIMLLSGIGLTTAARDAIDGYYVTATARGFEVLMLTLALAMGISLTLGIAFRFGVRPDIGTELGSGISAVYGTTGAVLIGAGFALTCYVRLIYVPLMAVSAGVVFAIYYALVPFVPQPGAAPGIAGVAAGIFAYLTYRWLKIPESAMAMAGVVGLIPGLAVFRGLNALMGSEDGVNAALPQLVLALATGLGLAAGATIGAQVVRRSFGLDKAAATALRRTRGAR